MCTRSHIVPGLRTRARHVVRPVKGALTAERTLSGRVISGVVSRLIYVPLVLLIVVNADRGRVVGANRPALDLLEELLGVRLGIGLGGGDPREQREPLRRRRLHERRAAHLARQRLDRLDPRPPALRRLRLERFGQTPVDVGGHPGGTGGSGGTGAPLFDDGSASAPAAAAVAWIISRREIVIGSPS